MEKNENEFSIKNELLIELPLTFRFPVHNEIGSIRPIYPTKSSFYQTNASICYQPEKPVSKIIPLHEKLL